MFHTESIRPNPCASFGRAGRLPSIIIETMTDGVKPLNGYFPVNTLPAIQMSDKLSIPPPPILSVGRHEDQPLSQPYQGQKYLPPVWLYRPSQVPPVRPTPQYTPLPALREQSLTLGQLK